MKRLSLEEQWEQVQAYYQKVYRMEFATRPPDHQIDWLYRQMAKLGASMTHHFAQAKPLRDRFVRSLGLDVAAERRMRCRTSSRSSAALEP